MEIWSVRYQHGRSVMRQGIQLHSSYHYHSDETEDKHHTTDQSKEVHRLFAKLIEEPQGHQVQIAIDKAVDAKLTLAKLTFAVLHHLLANTGETGILSQIGNITVHLGEQLNILNHILAIRLETAVHIV